MNHFKQTQQIAIYMEGHLGSDYGKMGYGVMRFSRNPINCIIDSRFKGKSTRDANLPYHFPVVGSIAEAKNRGAEVLILGIAPSGGEVPQSWHKPLQTAVDLGLCLINGLHDDLNSRYGKHLKKGQWIWDVRKPSFIPDIASGKAALLNNKRVLLVGTDMAVGKMTAGLEIYRWLQENRRLLKTDFLATGQIGMTITGKGIPLDAFKVDHACGAVEQMVLQSADADILIIEGQGSLLHPGSTATLPLMRGSCPTTMILCHRAKMTHLERTSVAVKIPPLKEVIALNQAVSCAAGALAAVKVSGIALNTSRLKPHQAIAEIKKIEDETGLPVEDVVRFDAAKLANALA